MDGLRILLLSATVLLLSSCSSITDEVVVVEDNKDILIERARKPTLIKDIVIDRPEQSLGVYVIPIKQLTEDQLIRLKDINADILFYNDIIIFKHKDYENIAKNLLELLRYKKDLEKNIEFYERQILDKQENK